MLVQVQASLTTESVSGMEQSTFKH